jgi:hypothetical protein
MDAAGKCALLVPMDPTTMIGATDDQSRRHKGVKLPVHRQGARRDRNISATVTARIIVPMDSTTSVVGTSLKLNTS